MKNIAKIFMLLGAMVIVSPAADAQVSVGLSVRIGPPALPVYTQPPCPVDGYLWEPGYWAYDDADGYYWVPGVWVAPPSPGLLWTPCYWGFDNGVYLYHAGYWGPHVGFYGGINYGYGYPGSGFYGGVWSGRSFRYNTAVFHVNRTVIHNTYVNRTVIHTTNSRASFNGRGGVMAQPRPEERRAMNEHHIQPTHTQLSHQQMAGRNPAQRLSANHGRPGTAAMNRINTHSISSPGHMANHAGVQHNPSPATHAAINNHTRTSPEVNRARQSNMEQHVQQRAPQAHISQPQHMQEPRMQQQHMQAQHMQPQRMQQQHVEQPRMQPQHMEQPHMQPQHMGGGGGQPHMGGGGGGGHMGGGGGGGHHH